MAAKNMVFNYDEDKINKIKEIADKNFRTVSGMIQMILIDYLQNPKDTNKKSKKKKIKITHKKGN